MEGNADIDRVDRIEIVNIDLETAALWANDPGNFQLEEAGIRIDQGIDHDRVLHPLLIESEILNHHTPIAERVRWIVRETNSPNAEWPFERQREIRLQQRYVERACGDRLSIWRRGPKPKRLADHGLIDQELQPLENAIDVGEKLRERRRKTGCRGIVAICHDANVTSSLGCCPIYGHPP